MEKAQEVATEMRSSMAETPKKLADDLEQRIETMGMKDRIFDVVIPTQEEIEVRDGKRRTVERHIFPGYVLVNMSLSEESWYVVRNTPNVTGFIGTGTIPTPVAEEEIKALQKRMGVAEPEYKINVEVNTPVKITDGPFLNLNGRIDEIDPTRGKLKISVSIFGRFTPVELEYWQVQRITD